MANQNKGGGRGFAGMDEDKQREIASKGGQASGGNFANDPERASEAGKKGGEKVSQDREHMSEIGKKGGQASGGNFANDRERASEAGRKGGESGGRNRGDNE